MKKKLYRNTDEKLVAGVIAGFADYFEQDVTLLRLLMFVFVVATGIMPGVLLYVGAWIIIPEKPTIEPVDKTDYTVYQ